MKIKFFVGVALSIYLVAVISILTSAFIIHENKKNSNISGQIASKSGEGGKGSSGEVNYLTVEEVAKHATSEDCWMVINNKVYDVGSFMKVHPGGSEVMVPYCGKDASVAFSTKDKKPAKDHSKLAYDMLANYFVGDLGSELPATVTDASNNSTNQPGTTNNRITTKTPAITNTQLTVSKSVASVSLSLTPEEVAKHGSLANCWLIISGKVYDVTSYIASHPGGANAIAPYCGKDGTSAFQTKGGTGNNHSGYAYGLLGNYLIGSLGASVVLNPGFPMPPTQLPPASLPGGGVPPAIGPPAPAPNPNPNPSLTLSAAEVASHNTIANCWLIISGKVYDVTRYIASHPGGAQAIVNFCGKDGTTAFQTKGGKGSNHSANAYNLLAGYLIGTLGSSVVVNPPAPGQPTPTPANPVPTPIAVPPTASCGSQGTLPAGVSAKYPGAAITKQSIGGDCKQELKILYNGECRSIHTNSDGTIKEDGKC